jgi:hypothetical protein
MVSNHLLDTCDQHLFLCGHMGDKAKITWTTESTPKLSSARGSISDTLYTQDTKLQKVIF